MSLMSLKLVRARRLVRSLVGGLVRSLVRELVRNFMRSLVGGLVGRLVGTGKLALGSFFFRRTDSFRHVYEKILFFLNLLRV